MPSASHYYINLMSQLADVMPEIVERRHILCFVCSTDIELKMLSCFLVNCQVII